MREVLVYVIEFTDGGEPETGELNRGSRQECEKVRDLIPAISYSGSRPVRVAYTRIVPAGALAAERRAALATAPDERRGTK